MKGFTRTLFYMEKELQNRSTVEVCPKVPGRSQGEKSPCTSRACPAGSWRLLRGSSLCDENHVDCEIYSGLKVLYGVQRGPKWLLDPSGLTHPPGHVVAVGGPSHENLLFRDKKSWIARVKSGTVAGVSFQPFKLSFLTTNH